ncbi:MAG: hypothetical protein KF709_01220 [Gemmatimonadaceae bacterium]|nr:hypothetical protein [Gemmatimonadaceae bacterium]
MSHVAWIKAHATEAPPALVERVARVFVESADLAQLDTAAALAAAGERLLQSVVRADDAAGRVVALDLLAADACVTWAFEAAAGLPDSLAARAAAAMQHYAAAAS